eukprot:gb/GEZN01002130.1/.p1 GENE.gb/GEZN01002130.1/~~gb/GEZN01002130.1/.p1  ORF type:complete len:811 (-),score=160.01 gb/GEZN01002130.1/:195-2393(-)
MVMACHTKDLVVKKMVYHYLGTWAHRKPDVAILVINTMQKDYSESPDPMVRGLALRSLSGLRLPQVVEHVLPVIRRGLKDPNFFVRKTAAIACAKVYRISPMVIKSSDLVDVLYDMLKDKHTGVVASVIASLNEILENEGGMTINKQIIMYLLNRIKQFSEWDQILVLQLAAKYTPADDNEMFSIMNVLNDRLRHSNSAVVLGTTNVFLKFTKDKPEIHQTVIRRLCEPLVTLMTGGAVELSFVVLSHIQLLVQRGPGIFNSNFKHFFIRYNDPLCVKRIKVAILTELADTSNMQQVLVELAEYVTDNDLEIVRESVRGIAKIAVKVEAALDEAIEQILAFLEMGTPYISAEAAVAIKDLLRKYPQCYSAVEPALHKCLKTVQDIEEDGKIAILWMIGEYGDTINSAPYILEPLVEAWDEEESNLVRLELLSATTKLFFKRPPEVQAMLGRLLKKAIEDLSRIDVRDRALLYYRLLRLDVQEAARVVNCPKVVVDVYSEARQQDLREALFNEFGTLSIIYGMPALRFIKEIPAEEFEEENLDEDEVPSEDQAQSQAQPSPQQPDPQEQQQQYAQPQQEQEQGSPPHQQPAPAEPLSGLLDFDSAPSTSAQPAGLSLKPNPTLDAATFQTHWKSAQPYPRQMQLAAGVQLQTFGNALKAVHIATMAAGQQAGKLKFYFYARDLSDNLFLIEVFVDVASGGMQATFKSSSVDQSLMPQFQSIFSNALTSAGLLQ